MPPTMFKLNQTSRSVADVIWTVSRWLPWWLSWISERKHFSNSKSPCCPDAFHRFRSIRLTVQAQTTIEDFQDDRRRCCLIILSCLTWRPSWILELNDSSNSKSRCGPNASHQVWAQSDRVRERMWFQDFQDARQAAILDSQTEWFKQFWISMSLRCLPSKFGTIGPTVWEEMPFEEFQDGRHGGHLGYRKSNYFSNSEISIMLRCLPLSWAQFDL